MDCIFQDDTCSGLGFTGGYSVLLSVPLGWDFWASRVRKRGMIACYGATPRAKGWRGKPMYHNRLPTLLANKGVEHRGAAVARA